jgi:hypothetical protein
MVGNERFRLQGELTVKRAVELFAGLNGPVGFASASSEPLIMTVGVCETLVAV